MEKKGFLQSFGAEINKMKAMDSKKRWEYFAGYYLLKIVVIAIVVAFFAYTIYNMFFNKVEIIIEGAVVNLPATEEMGTFLTEDFMEYLGNPSGEAYLEADNNITFDLEKTSQYEYGNRMKLMAMVAAGEVDYMIMNEEVYSNLKGQDLFKPFEWETDYNLCDGLAIDISGTDLAKRLGYDEKEKIYIGVLAGSKSEYIEEFFEYIN